MNKDRWTRRPSHRWPACLLGLAILLLGTSSLAASPDTQRDLFVKAEQALERGRNAEFARLREQLSEYPLLPYLELQYLQKRLARARNSEVEAFLKKYRGEPVADILRRQWLDHLAKQRRWKSYLAFYTPQSNIRRRCNHLQALIETGKKTAAWPLVQKVWLFGGSRPSACDPVFKAWEAAGRRTDSLTWQRIALAMDKGKWRLARYLGRKLGRSDQAWVRRWIRLYTDPKTALRARDFKQPHPYRETMLAHAVRRLARFDGMGALKLWKVVEKRYPFPADQRAATTRRIAIALERNNAEEAYAFINSITPDRDDRRLRIACFRAALLPQDWQTVLDRLKEWPDAERETDRWQYWFARALTHTGQTHRAQLFFRKAAENRSYYGFLAADQINAPYHLLHRKTPEDLFTRVRLERLSGVKRALELHALGRNVMARHEWYYVTRGLDKPELRAAAVIAKENGWLDQAIFTLAKTGYWDDLKLRFPLKYRKLVSNEAKSNTLDMAWIYAVIRQESAFMHDARSQVGAMGLMQLMPATARTVARKALKRKPPARREIIQPALNIALGSAYLRQLKSELDNNPVLATAAYNAGPYRVNKWLPENSLSADIWVELAPFNETRRYLRRVLSYMVIYDKRLGREPIRLKERMKPIIALQKHTHLAGT